MAEIKSVSFFVIILHNPEEHFSSGLIFMKLMYNNNMRKKLSLEITKMYNSKKLRQKALVKLGFDAVAADIVEQNVYVKLCELNKKNMLDDEVRIKKGLEPIEKIEKYMVSMLNSAIIDLTRGTKTAWIEYTFPKEIGEVPGILHQFHRKKIGNYKIRFKYKNERDLTHLEKNLTQLGLIPIRWIRGGASLVSGDYTKDEETPSIFDLTKDPKESTLGLKESLKPYKDMNWKERRDHILNKIPDFFQRNEYAIRLRKLGKFCNDLISKVLSGDNQTDISKEMKLSQATVYRKLDHCYQKAANFMFK